ncbi:MAG TPA: hypothetical protein VGP43_02390 [Chitinophagaceae bacterium]|nr:hypothetical protein [Chitinophagaceae bacterium]
MKTTAATLILLITIIVIYNSCSKGGGGSTSTPPTNPCAGVTVIVSGSVTANTGSNNGSISATATSGSSFTFNLNGGAFQSSGMFSNLATGTYTVTAKNNDGCTGSAQFTVIANTGSACTGTPGPLFTAVRSVIRTNCAISGCHTNPSPQNGIDYMDDCQIVAQKDRIKIRAVDGNPTFMPPPPTSPLSAADKKKITDWIAAGGLYTN